MSAKYLILDEHTLGYTIAGHPTMLGILRASVLRGSPYDPRLDGFTILAPTAVLRPATAADFDAYRVKLPPDFEQMNPKGGR